MLLYNLYILMNITEKINQLKLNVKQHQAQIQILNKEIKQLEKI